MGESHTVIPIRSIPRDERTIGYFRDQGFELPDPPSTAREPTPNDVRAVVNELADYEVTYAERGDSLYIDMVNRAIACSPGNQGRRGGGDWAVIWIRNYHGSMSEDLPCELYFHRASKELVERVVGGLAKRCGPFIVMINNESPLFITE